MKNLLLLFLAVVALSFSACQKEDPVTPDPCAGITCLNGGVCDNGACDCPPNFSGTRCQTFTNPDPCFAIICQNGGTCVNGTCDCPPGYTGTNCQTAIIPTKVRLDKIVLTSYPTTRANGSVWDNVVGNSTYPDVFVTLNSGTTASLNGYLSNNVDNQTGASITYTTGLPVEILNPSSQYVLGVWDDDTPGEEFMIEGTFIPNDFSSGFPSTISLANSDNSLAFVLHVEWIF